MILALFLFLQTNLFQQYSQAFPEMVRDGYVNCNTCHISLNGGGLLNDYGRAIIREELSIWKSSDEKSREQDFLYGVLDDAPISKWLKLGADVRSVYFYQNDEFHNSGQTIFMQGDFEAAATFGRFTILGDSGVKQDPGKNAEYISRRHWIGYAITDEWNIRGGKFEPTYGINTPEHVTLTRDPLHLGQGNEGYNLELSRITEQWSLFVSGLFGRPDDSKLKPIKDKGFAVQGSYSPTEKLKFGVNTLYGSTDLSKRWLLGGFAILGITHELLFMTEMDYQYKDTPVKGFASTQKLSYELIPGLWAFGVQEYGKFDFNNDLSQDQVYGVGLQAFPRAHFQFDFQYSKAKTPAYSAQFYDTAWLMSHVYF